MAGNVAQVGGGFRENDSLKSASHQVFAAKYLS
jgi:hypothetical protein